VSTCIEYGTAGLQAGSVAAGANTAATAAAAVLLQLLVSLLKRASSVARLDATASVYRPNVSQWFVTPSALDAEPWGGARTDPSRLSNGFALPDL